MVSKNGSKLLKDPDKIIQENGRLKFIIEKKVAKDYPKTCAAMDRVANACVRDDEQKRKGNDDYSLSLQTLLNAFDIFIKECTSGKRKTGSKENYDLTNPCELTIYLLWQIRHTWTHNGGVIDEKCKKEYERIIQLGCKNDIHAIIDFPDEITEGLQFTLMFDDYKKITKCILKYIEERASPEDYKIIATRHSITNIKMGASVIVNYDFGAVSINLHEACDKGCDLENEQFILPPGTIYDHSTERFYFSNGEWLSAKKIRIQK